MVAGAVAKGDAEFAKLLPVMVAAAEAPTAAPVATPEPIRRMEIVVGSHFDNSAFASAFILATLSRRGPRPHVATSPPSVAKKYNPVARPPLVARGENDLSTGNRNSTSSAQYDTPAGIASSLKL